MNAILAKAKKGKAKFKEYKAYRLEDLEKAIADEDSDTDKPATAAAPVPLQPLEPLYFYHPDHLGTSTALTDFNGNAYQFFLNLPFGETMAEQHGTQYYQTPYKFNGKELDEETGLYYYGARYYDPKVSIWYSVDPLAEKMPSWSPYSFCFNNPMRFVDPDGRAPDWHEDVNNKNILIKDKGDNATTLKEYVNKNHKDANLTKSASETLYSSMKDNKVNIDKLNPETLGKNLFGLNYPGGNNPKKYNGEYDYSVKPTEIEVPAYIHDKDYDEARAVGGGALFFNSAVTTADNNFVKRMDKLVDKYRAAGEYKLMIKASILGNGLSAASSFKQSYQDIKRAVIVPASLTNPIYLHP